MPSRSQVYSPKLSLQYQLCLVLWDTKREAAINLGRQYNHPPLEYGECNINAKYAEVLGLNTSNVEQEIVYFSIPMGIQMNTLIRRFNEVAKKNNQTKMKEADSDIAVRVPCRVKRVTKGTEGKFPSANA